MKKPRTKKYKGYCGTIEYSLADECLHGKIDNINDTITYEAKLFSELRSAFEESVDRYLVFCEKVGKEPEKGVVLHKFKYLGEII